MSRLSTSSISLISSTSTSTFSSTLQTTSSSFSRFSCGIVLGGSGGGDTFSGAETFVPFKDASFW